MLPSGSATCSESTPGLARRAKGCVVFIQGFGALCNLLVQKPLSWDLRNTTAPAGTRGTHRADTYLVIHRHFRVGIPFVESFHLAEQVCIWQIHHPELHRAGVGQGSELELSEGSTKSKVSDTCSRLSQNQPNTQTFTLSHWHCFPHPHTRTTSCL